MSYYSLPPLIPHFLISTNLNCCPFFPQEHAANKPDSLINPVYFCRKLEQYIGDNAVLIGDGGDFVATCAYTIKPRGPLGWLDPGS